MPTVIVTRDSGYADRFRSYKIYIDESKVGCVKNGGRFECQVPVGEHTICCKIDWARSNKIAFRLDSDAVEKQFNAKSALRGGNVLLSFLYITIWTDRYIELKEA